MSALSEEINRTLTPERVKQWHAEYLAPSTSADRRTLLRSLLEATGRPVPVPTPRDATMVVASALADGKFTAAEANYFGALMIEDFETGARVIERLPGRAPAAAPSVAPAVDVAALADGVATRLGAPADDPVGRAIEGFFGCPADEL